MVDFTVNVSATTPDAHPNASDPYYVTEAQRAAVEALAAAASAGASAKKLEDFLNGGEIGEGIQGPPGKSAYELAVENGFTGSESEWLLSLHGSDGEDGAIPQLAIGTVTEGDTASATLTGDQLSRVLNLVLPRATPGTKGDTGLTPVINIGTVTATTGAPSVAVRGTPESPILDFTLKTGNKGDIGTTPQLSIGTVTQGDAPAVTIRGTAAAPILDFVLQKGTDGLKGDAGTAATLTLGTVTVSDTEASVVSRGTPQARIFDFVLQRGPKGNTGDAAPAGIANNYKEKIQTVTPGGTVTVANGGYIISTATGPHTWTFDTSSLPAGYALSWTLKLKNGAAGVQTFTDAKTAGGTALKFTSGVDYFAFIWDGETLLVTQGPGDVK